MSVIDIAAISGLLFICQLDLTGGSPLLCNMSQAMDLPLESAHTQAVIYEGNT